MTCSPVGFARLSRSTDADVPSRCLFPSAESEAGVVGAGPEGAGPQRTSVTLHLPRTAPGPAQRPRHTSQNLHTPQEVSGNEGRGGVTGLPASTY